MAESSGAGYAGAVTQAQTPALPDCAPVVTETPECFPAFPSALMLGPGIRHLYNSRVAVYRRETTMQDGAGSSSWHKLTTFPDPALGVPGEMKCRLDLLWVRPGKDQPVPVSAGVAPDRMGIMFCDVTTELKAGDQVRCLSGAVVGIFELRVVPDVAIGFSAAHHCEVQVVEVAQSLDLEPSRTFPAKEAYEV